VESLSLGVDADFFCPATLVHAAAPASGPRAAVILSHDDGQCMGSPRILAATQRLASLGYWVIVPEHASLNQASLQRAESRGLVSLYGAGDTVGLPPVALRVADDLAALRYLASRPEVDPQQIVAVGAGVGGIDAALSALVDPRIAAVAAVDVTTARDWAATVAPDLLWVTHVMPYLPGLLSKTDWDYCFGALAPRPLVLVEQKDGWPKSGFEQAVATATAAYRLSGAEKSLLALGSRDVTEDLENGTPEGLLKPLVAAARTLVPQPPPPGMIGTLDGLRSRETVDSATGIVWLVSVMDAYDQQFVDGGYRLQSWSFYNDNGAAQQGRSATPLIFKKEGDAFVLTGIGKTRVNTGGGMQTFPFEVTAGSDEVGKGYYFGWHDGDQAGTANAGVVEFDNSVQDRMSIVTLDGQLGDQKLQLGGKYRIQSEYPRTYSIQAVSKRP